MLYPPHHFRTILVRIAAQQTANGPQSLLARVSSQRDFRPPAHTPKLNVGH